MTETPQVLFGEEEIRRRVQAVGAEIGRSYAGREICVVGLMKSCLVFMADLIRVIPSDLTCHMLRVTCTKDTGTETPRNDIVYYVQVPFEDRDVLLLDDIVDTGITLDFILEHIRERSPRSLKSCVLINKPEERKIDVEPDWSVFTMEESLDRFMVGYGLDSKERYRGLAYIGTIPHAAPLKEAPEAAVSPTG